VGALGERGQVLRPRLALDQLGEVVERTGRLQRVDEGHDNPLVKRQRSPLATATFSRLTLCLDGLGAGWGGSGWEGRSEQCPEEEKRRTLERRRPNRSRVRLFSASVRCSLYPSPSYPAWRRARLTRAGWSVMMPSTPSPSSRSTSSRSLT